MNIQVIENPEIINCNIYVAEIPESVSTNAEADEYVSSYCGLACYQQWREN